MSPIFLVKVQEHLLFQFVFTIIYGNGVIMTVETMDKCLD